MGIYKTDCIQSKIIKIYLFLSFTDDILWKFLFFQSQLKPRDNQVKHKLHLILKLRQILIWM